MIIIAHRGASWYAPENTFAAFEKALVLGCQQIELDVHLSRDGVPVVIHDEILDASTNGSGPVAEHTVAALKKLDAGSWFSPRFAGERIPTLDEVFARYGNHVYINVEVKPNSPDLVGKVMAAVQRHEVENSVAIISFHLDVLKKVRRVNPCLAAGALTMTLTPDLIDALAGEAAFVGTLLRADHDFPELLARCRQRDLRIGLFGAMMVRDLKRAWELGIDYLVSDYPDQVQALVQAWGSPEAETLRFTQGDKKTDRADRKAGGQG